MRVKTDNKRRKVVLAYSGGLDTSVILVWLKKQGYDVIAYCADVGQREDFNKVKEKALRAGASNVYIEDLKEEFVTEYIFPAFKANCLYEGKYLLGTALARPLIAKRQIRIAAEENAEFVAHGATGKGNDQVRFELAYYALNPNIKVISPWKDPKFLELFKGRQCMLDYTEKHGIPVKATKENSYSEDENLLHISHESGILEDPSICADESIYSWTKSPEEALDKPIRIVITFKDGIPIQVKNIDDGTVKENPLELFIYLNKVGSENGIGRVDMVENRFIGI
jgi:argininosuccinate synthase